MHYREVQIYLTRNLCSIMNQNYRTRDDPRIVGTYDERLAFLCIARRVQRALSKLHYDLDFDHQSFEHITLNFLRERRGKNPLWGQCSYSHSNPHYKTKHQNRHGIHRISLYRPLLKESLVEAIRTVHHEFVHAIVKDIHEPHNAEFLEHEGRIEPSIGQIQREIECDFNALGILL